MTVGYDYPGSGGWRASNYRDRTRLTPDIPFLASERYTVKRGGATFKKSANTGAVNEVQSIASSGATAGTFTLSFDGATTAALAFNATAAVISAALQALPSVGTANLSATGGPANTTATVVTFSGALAGFNVPLITVDKTGLTGAGATAVTETTKGVPAGVTEIRKGTFCMPDPSNAGYYKAYTGDTIITDGSVGPSGFLMESINVADGDVTEGILIQGSVLAARVGPAPLAGAVLTAIAGRIVLQ
jgi:hypothetical protein